MECPFLLWDGSVIENCCRPSPVNNSTIVAEVGLQSSCLATAVLTYFGFQPSCHNISGQNFQICFKDNVYRFSIMRVLLVQRNNAFYRYFSDSVLYTQFAQ
jgi:hypothetical protein